ncbi:carboxymuconolactone decarboxylase family protein (plasmid) [Candidatus Chlorohelix allophototropha]|uniref:Carboxymuconolactone decarboxylase family protein n=1 Tax=Candidatus Chlorohelix allophototropha TaxID=3003348 RepID=A0ABY9BA65_9CHLR|nr:carboxymuconolactone decarboxylase family protein [Chloroflexota bacterium L227-S17]
MPTKPFRRRKYDNLSQFRAELAYLLRNRKNLRHALKGETISGAFRQRLMLVVTSVNRCRYCAAYHSQVSLVAGLTHPEIAELLEGTIEDCPSEEIPALLYARQWAENNSYPDKEAYDELAGIYGVEKAELIELALKTIRVGNLSGNTFDYLLCRLSRGLWGCPELRQKSA